MTITGIVFIIYLAILIGVGIATFRFNKTQEDYLLAGRKLGPWVVAFSERASGESAWLLLALPGAAIAIGMGEIYIMHLQFLNIYIENIKINQILSGYFRHLL
jgi:sodium/proline symporter